MRTSSYAKCRRTCAARMKVWMSGVVMTLAVAAPSLSAQTTTGSITGIVSSSDGARLPHAQITAIEQSSGRQARGSSDHLGAFVFESYTPGNGNSFVATRNESYWRSDEGLPHLDAVEMRVVADTHEQGRSLPRGDDDARLPLRDERERSRTEGAAAMKNLLGGKGANLAEMCRLGITVPSGFTISTEACTVFTERGKDAAVDMLARGKVAATDALERLQAVSA